MEHLPTYIALCFALTTATTVFLFARASNFSTRVLLIITIWMLIQAAISLTGFYTFTHGMPPRFILLLLPPLILILFLFFSKRGQSFIDKLDLKWLTWLHIVRIPVEIVLFWLFLHRAVPKLMTFEGWNLDIISGLTTPVMIFIAFRQQLLNKSLLIAWNVICMLLLVNIVLIAVLCAPVDFQKLAFGQPDVAIFYFPFSWLPSCIVPLVLFSHLAAIRKLLIAKNPRQSAPNQ
jgi:hypothetical protein